MKSPYGIIKRACITEKSMQLKDRQNKYTFEVDRGANKLEIKRAVEEIFKVKVLRVNTMMVRGRSKRIRLRWIKTPSWKKAVVTLKEGDRIELFESV